MSHHWMRRVAWLSGWEPRFKHGTTGGRGMWTFGALLYTLKYMANQVKADCWTVIYRQLQEHCRPMTSPRCRDEYQNLVSNWHRGQIIKDHRIDRLRHYWFSSPSPNLEERSSWSILARGQGQLSASLWPSHHQRCYVQETNILKHFEQPSGFMSHILLLCFITAKPRDIFTKSSCCTDTNVQLKFTTVSNNLVAERIRWIQTLWHWRGGYHAIAQDYSDVWLFKQ